MNWTWRQHRSTPLRTNAEVLALLDKANKIAAIEDNEKIVTDTNAVDQSSLKNEAKVTVNSGGDQSYRVLWAKPSGRKKRVWEGDGFLSVKGNLGTLCDEDGQIMATAPMPPSNLLTSGYIFKLGSKEVEIVEEYFGDGQMPKGGSNDSKPFFNNRQSKKAKPNNAVIHIPTFRGLGKPLHHKHVEPFELPPPPCDHQWNFNKDKKTIKKVVVDTFLTSQLRPHQREGIVFLYECIMGYKYEYTGAILADEMGLGKTLQSIVLIWTLLKYGPYGSPIVRRVLVVTPSTLCVLWQKEFLKWLGSERIQPFVVDNNNKPKDFNEQRNSSVIIISYERLLKHVDDLEKSNFDLIVCDEAHRLKNSNIKAAQSLDMLSCKRRVLLTGTPFQNNLQEYYALTDIANPGILGTYSEYKEKFEDPILQSRNPSCSDEEHDIGDEKAAELHFITSTFILRRTQSVLENILPPKTEYIICCSLTDLQKEIYSNVLDEWWNTRDFQQISALSLIVTLKKICNHLSLIRSTDKEDNTFDAVNKFVSTQDVNDGHSSKVIILKSLLINIIKNNEKVVIVSCSTQVLDILAKECDSLNITHCRLDGSTPVQQRQSIVDKFNVPINQKYGQSNQSSDVLLLSSRAGGVGLSVPGASRLILYDSDWNPAIDNQAMARIWRDGQKRPVHIYRFLATGTIEEKIYQRQIYKMGLSDAVLQSMNTKASLKMSDSELKDLFTANFLTFSSTHDIIQCACNKKEDDNIDYENIFDEEDKESTKENQDSNSANNDSYSFNQLRLWDHFKAPIESSQLKESCLDFSDDFISFIFRKTHKTAI